MKKSQMWEVFILIGVIVIGAAAVTNFNDVRLFNNENNEVSPESNTIRDPNVRVQHCGTSVSALCVGNTLCTCMIFIL